MLERREFEQFRGLHRRQETVLGPHRSDGGGRGSRRQLDGPKFVGGAELARLAEPGKYRRPRAARQRPRQRRGTNVVGVLRSDQVHDVSAPWSVCV